MATTAPRRRLFTEARHLCSVPAGRLLVGAVVLLALVTVAGLAVLWPRGEPARAPAAQSNTPTLPATVEMTRLLPCPGRGHQRCLALRIEVEGRRAELSNLGPAATAPQVSAGAHIRVTRVELPAGTPTDIAAQSDPYAYVDLDRSRSVLALVAVLAFVALVVLRWRGLFAVAGVGISVLLVVTFVVPAILDGRPALAVALIGSLAVMFVTLVLTNGVGAQSLAAALGVAVTLALAAVAALLATRVAHLDGRTDELSTLLVQQNSVISLRAVVLAGMLIGSLGVLADTAVTQSSAVMALRRADPRQSPAALYRAALVVGRDHLSATIHTLVLAYVGGTLPLLLVLRSLEVTATDGLNYQDVVQPIAAAVVGCLALIAAVPLTTFLASRLVSHLPVDVLPEHAHVH